MFPETIATDRLRLERLTRELVDPLEAYEHFANGDDIEEETQHISWNPHTTPKETWDVLGEFEERWEQREDAIYALFPREGEAGTGEFAGTTGLHFEWDKHAADLGIWLRKPFWGRGYSGERAAALFALAFSRLDLELVSVAHFSGNEQSKRAIEKYVERFGGRYEGRLRNHLVDADGEVHDAHRYSVSQEEWSDAVSEERTAVSFEG
ncbi:GNAT family N-acetyltransferase [Halalkalicoccus jeotgali]|uniref:GCN5-like N-acetyltransferase n=1 Tax=Halalkalicoccus jeotgali (strain DSM 18796 / CECT 7217 / JCM 14584 / KCTC 4019 / B3) TaxID=795797 RepID=D8JAK6_HALJB|nr:GNAT family protein [Halalkalicoccus jeotgali]ADJ14728.1 GCN5-related N-acetyltransferase [Halalkalicoccus jeotgali B3]ELY39310.1 GCN5-like N-acetyltransferase [Halalkalicoccus jeotgali B3]